MILVDKEDFNNNLEMTNNDKEIIESHLATLNLDEPYLDEFEKDYFDNSELDFETD